MERKDGMKDNIYTSDLRKMVAHFLTWSRAGRNQEFKHAEFLSTYET